MVKLISQELRKGSSNMSRSGLIIHTPSACAEASVPKSAFMPSSCDIVPDEADADNNTRSCCFHQALPFPQQTCGRGTFQLGLDFLSQLISPLNGLGGAFSRLWLLHFNEDQPRFIRVICAKNFRLEKVANGRLVFFRLTFCNDTFIYVLAPDDNNNRSRLW
ncbi:MAG: hypothetical protein IPL70_11010 [Uliginosibacterium sp.]|nr:hypothetical protein [Uliginosibacterium sp.]